MKQEINDIAVRKFDSLVERLKSYQSVSYHERNLLHIAYFQGRIDILTEILEKPKIVQDEDTSHTA